MSGQPDFAGQRVLLGSHLMSGYTGSEMHVAELANFFQSRSALVTCLALEAKGPMAAELQAAGIDIISPWQLVRREQPFDLVWSHQETVFLWLHVALGVAARQHLHGLLSWQQKIERIPLIPRELVRDNLRFLGNSAETRDAAAMQAGRSDIGVMPNFVPEGYAGSLRGPLPPRPQRIAIVSNHVPQEVLEAKDLLERQSVGVTIFGKGHTYTRLDKTTLTDFDLVITIGKTVQYCLAQGIPVFVYDRFGGPGYMSPRNIDAHAAMNFSGRSDPRKRSAERLARELLDGYDAAKARVEELRTVHAPAFAIETCVMGAVGALDANPLPALTATERLATLRRHLLRRPQPLARMVAPRGVAALTAIYDRLTIGGTDRSFRKE